MKTAFRYGLVTKRMCDAYNSRCTIPNQKLPGIVMLVKAGDQCTMSGSGEIYEKFKRTGVIDGFTENGLNPVKYTDPNYDAAALREMNFRDTFDGMKYDCTKSKMLCVIFDPYEFQLKSNNFTLNSRTCF